MNRNIIVCDMIYHIDTEIQYFANDRTMSLWDLSLGEDFL